MEIKIYDVKEAAKVLHVGNRAIYDLIKEGKLKAVRVGKSLRIPEESITDYLSLTALHKTKREQELEDEVESLKLKLAVSEKLINNIKNELLKVAL